MGAPRARSRAADVDWVGARLAGGAARVLARRLGAPGHRTPTLAAALLVILVGGGAGCAPDAPSPSGSDAVAADGAQAPGGALWVMDAADQPVGALVRRGGDDGRTGRSLYDLVRVFDPTSGLFFDVTMSDGQVRYPATTYFVDAHCQQPVGVAAGACQTCVAGYGMGLLHAGVWWRVVGGSPVTQIAMGSTRSAGISEICVAHGTTSAKGFPLEPVAPPTPPSVFAPPLHFAWRTRPPSSRGGS